MCRACTFKKKEHGQKVLTWLVAYSGFFKEVSNQVVTFEVSKLFPKTQLKNHSARRFRSEVAQKLDSTEVSNEEKQ